MRLPAIIQARMSSKRLPGKSLLLVQDKPLLQYVIEKVKRSKGVSDVIVATSDRKDDAPIEKFCKAQEIVCYRGPLDDVAGRFKKIIDLTGFKSFIRVCGDSPFLDPKLIDYAIDLYGTGRYDLVSNIQVRTFPKGQSVEVIRGSAFLEACAAMTDESDKEHVTPYLYRHPDIFRIADWKSAEDHSATQLSIDTKADLTLFKATVAKMTRPHWKYSWQEILELRENLQDGAA